MSSRPTNSDVLLTYEEFDLLMSIAVDWLDDDGPSGPSEFPIIASLLEELIALHGTGSNVGRPR